MKIASIILILLGVLATAFASAAPDVHTIAQAVDARYNHLRTLRAEFKETYRGGGVERTESGTLWLKKPGKMRWEYRSPKEKLFVSDGKDAWFYVPGDHQVRRTAVKKLDDLRSPLAFLLGKTKLEKELDGLSIAPDVAPAKAGNTVLRGVPKSARERINQVQLEVTSDFRLARIVIEEADGGVTEYAFEGQVEDTEIPNQQFAFVPPPGVEVVEETFGQ